MTYVGRSSTAGWSWVGRSVRLFAALSALIMVALGASLQPASAVAASHPALAAASAPAAQTHVRLHALPASMLHPSTSRVPWRPAPANVGGQPHTTPPQWTTGPQSHVSGRSIPVAESNNWAGLIAGNATFTGVGADWTVPTVKTSTVSVYSATWVGLDGYSDSSLIQTGTEQDIVGSVPQYDAWYEILPAPPVVLGTVSPGDQMSAAIVETSGVWTIDIVDVTSNTGEPIDVPYSGPGETAEWVEEAPTVGTQPATLANFGTVNFTNMGANSLELDQATVLPVYMANSALNVIAYPSTISGDTMTIKYGSPPAPAVSYVSPNQGPATGGTLVTITGSNFNTVELVQFGGVPAPNFNLVTPGEIQVAAPPERAGVVNITVKTFAGTSLIGIADKYTFTGSSGSGPPTGGIATHGYWLVGGDGGIFSYGLAKFHGSTGAMVLQRPVVGITPTQDRAGYWLAATDGGIFAFGDAGFHGSIPGLHINPAGSPGPGRALDQPIVGMVPSADGGGYFMVAADGGVFAFGDAHYAGSCLSVSGGCSGAAVSVMPDATGNGYWVITRTGHTYAFGDAINYGGTVTTVPVTSAVRSPDGRGYWMLLGNGAVDAFGDARYHGSIPGDQVTLNALDPATAIFATADGAGYWVATAKGVVYPFGDAVKYGDLNGQRLNAPIITGTGW